MEAPDLLHGGGRRTFLDGLNFLFIYMNPLSQNHITQEDDLRYDEMTLLKVTIKLFLSQNAQDLVKLVCMLLFILLIHKYDIKVHDDKVAYYQPKHIIQ